MTFSEFGKTGTRTRGLFLAFCLMVGSAACSESPNSANSGAVDASTGGDSAVLFDTLPGSTEEVSDAGTTADLGDGGQTCEFAADPKPGQPGAPCTKAGDCDGNLCVEGPAGGVCTFQCVNCCPNGWACQQNLTGSDTAFLCLPRGMALCQPCTNDSECAAIDSTALCVSGPVAGQGRFCGGGCGKNDDCPKDYACKSVEGTQGGAMQCVRTAGECSCSPKASAAGVSTPCNSSNDQGSCSGKRTCGMEGLGACDAPAAVAETCNGQDDNCDGNTDEGLGDLDGDGLADCSDLDKDGDGTPDDKDCAPLDKTVFPGAKEACNGVDDDCDGETDEQDATGCKLHYADADQDGFGDAVGKCLCNPVGVYTALVPGDCADTASTAKPGAEEVCGNGQDDNCDGVTDEAAGTKDCKSFYMDGDGDGFGTGAAVCQCGPSGNVSAPKADDCNDASPGAFPGATETCNGLDDDCDGKTDEADAEGCSLAYADGDGDGFGDAAKSACLCKPDSTFPAATAGDCNDASAGVKPGGKEVCGGGDEDCDGQTDESNATGCISYYTDADGDGYGGATAACQCGASPNFPVKQAGDCEDQSKTIHPGAKELCDGVDNDCNGKADEGYLLGGSCTSGTGACTGVGKFVCTPDGSATVCSAQAGAGKTEACNDVDDNCNGVTDEGCDDDKDGYCDASLVYSASKACPKGGKDCNDANAVIRPGAVETCNGVDDDCSGTIDQQTQACSTGCGSGVETCQAGKWVGCTAKKPACTTGACCDGCNFKAATTQCGTAAYAKQTICSGTCGGDVHSQERWQYCTGTGSTCGTSNLKWIDKGVADDCSANEVCSASGTTATCKACANGCASGQCKVQAQHVICVDPGYGGKDPGAEANGLVEKNLNLSMGLHLKAWLDQDSANTAGGGNWKVVMTRTTDVTLTPTARAKICNDAKAERVLSIFNNGLKGTGVAFGTETYVENGYTSATLTFAKQVQAQVVAKGGTFDRGVKTGDYIILTNTPAIGCLTLPGFVDNKGDAAKLGSDTWRNTVAKGLMMALQQSFGLPTFTP